MTVPSHTDLSQLLTSQGWRSVALVASAVPEVWTNDYAVVGIVSVGTAIEVVSSWADCQVQMAELRKATEVGTNKDLYLLFFIPRIEPSAYAVLQTITNDTHVCRKICIETGTRSIVEAIFDTPLLTPGLNTPSTATTLVVSKGTPTPQLQEELLRDLATRSAPVILDNVLAGKYRTQSE
jgi:hypothetical protein